MGNLNQRNWYKSLVRQAVECRMNLVWMNSQLKATFPMPSHSGFVKGTNHAIISLYKRIHVVRNVCDLRDTWEKRVSWSDSYEKLTAQPQARNILNKFLQFSHKWASVWLYMKLNQTIQGLQQSILSRCSTLRPDVCLIGSQSSIYIFPQCWFLVAPSVSPGIKQPEDLNNMQFLMQFWAIAERR